MQAYNWRPGVSISQYIRFHGLLAPAKGLDIDGVNTWVPPDLLFDRATLEKGGHPYFSAPIRMKFVGSESISPQGKLNVVSAREYGSYQLETVDGKIYNPARQRAMLTIKEALERRITKS
jgi:hypothetical protein